MKNFFSVCFSGHRKLENFNAVYMATELIIIKLIEQGANVFYNGFALGFDLLAAKIIINLKIIYPNIKLIAILPCPPEFQTKKWNEYSKLNYNNALNKADDIIVLSEKYYNGCMQVRNKYLVENSNYCICYLTQSTGGTAFTVKYAVKNSLNIINIAEKL